MSDTPYYTIFVPSEFHTPVTKKATQPPPGFTTWIKNNDRKAYFKCNHEFENNGKRYTCQLCIRADRVDDEKTRLKHKHYHMSLLKDSICKNDEDLPDEIDFAIMEFFREMQRANFHYY
ncbi:hypothetical protein TVAG_249500 [Trichomonas vaginalis G3]|uniref:Uncharacterized protein n=1 Tax=Trichomonas vaginalis (strain ATCC PRA-98 / G3) TaxID=412133 RepID=A2DCF3_TRIV3|nr:hypothetical protein TVAGG3_0957020 [Trichomonas vaginalis G3]EAY21890.1 hypothetical protein TVAG_249500 [Trichomonas vaginalis G3]KAI5487634.1 hypothetical protein TVAGG3_0957020 [Trichomonas vaginalis G3]|eukprot:XP_001582876.1 hypothetical protein [Trichomonas vaginalis G3]